MARNSRWWLLVFSVFAFLSPLVHTATFAGSAPSTQTKTGIEVDRQDDTVWIMRTTNEQGRVLEVAPRRWFQDEHCRVATLELHGRHEVFDDAGVLQQSQWYFRGKAVSHDEFVRLSEAVTLQEYKTPEATDEDKETESFLLLLSVARKNKNFRECQSIIRAKREASPDWVPAIIAEYGYVLCVDHDKAKALEALELIKQKADARKMQDASTGDTPLICAHLWNRFVQVRDIYAKQTAKGLRKELHLLDVNREQREDHRESMLFPPGDMMIAYLLASGVRINTAALSEAVELQVHQTE